MMKGGFAIPYVSHVDVVPGKDLVSFVLVHVQLPLSDYPFLIMEETSIAIKK